MAEIHILGPVRVRANGHAISVGTNKIRGLFGILLLSANMAVPADRIVERLWDKPPTNPYQTLQGYVSKLRGVVERTKAATLLAEHGSYRLLVTKSTVDYYRFQASADRGSRAARQGDYSNAVTELSTAVELWQGRPFADVSGSWIQSRGETMMYQELLPVHQDLLESHLRLGNDDHVLTEVRQLLVTYETDETLMEIWLRALARLEGPAAVRRTFNGFVTKLKETIDTDPSDRLVHLSRRLIDQAGTHRPTRRPAPPHRPPPQMLPRDIPNFVGRSDVMRQLDALLARDGGQPAVVCLDGEPGVGKTALALRWAHARRDEFPDGVLYADLNGYGPGSPVEPGTVLTEFLRTLGIPAVNPPRGLPESAGLLQQALAGRHMLVVLDNVNDSAHVQPLLAPTSPCPVLITSRQQLNVLTFQAGAHSITVPTLLADDATALLQQRIGAERAFEDIQALHELMALCDGLPLALQIVGMRVVGRPDTPMRDLANYLRGRRLLDAGSHGDGGPITLRAVFDLSSDGLHPAADRLYQIMGLHPSTSISTPAAAAMAGLSIRDTDNTLDMLVEAHLVRQQGEDNYRMHDLLHLHANARAHDNQPVAAQREATRRMADWYLLSVGRAVERLAPQRKPVPPLPNVSDVVPMTFDSHEAAMNWCHRQRPQILAVTHQAAEIGLDHHVWRLVGTFAGQLNRYGDPREAIDVHQLALRSARITGSREGEAGNLNNLGVLDFRLGRYDTAELHFTQAVRVFQELDDEPGEAQALHNIGNTYLERGMLRKADDLHRRSLEIAARIGDRMGEARAYHRLGEVHHKLERPDVAGEFLADALKVRTELHDEPGRAATLQLLGQLSVEAGDAVHAIEYCEHALAIDQRTGDERQASVALRTMAEAHYRQGMHEVAAACADESATLCHALIDIRGEARALELLGRARDASGDHELARLTWRKAMSLFQEVDDPHATELATMIGSPGATRRPLPEPRTMPLRSSPNATNPRPT